MNSFEEVEHTADWAFRARGATPAELFENAARAMFALQAGGPWPARAEGEARSVEVQGFDRETLLVNWLNELLYLQEKRGETYGDFKVQAISETRLRAQVRGRPGQNAARMIKAVTFHGLEIKRTPDGWEATVVVDV